MSESIPDQKARLRREAFARRSALPGHARAQFAERLIAEGLRLAQKWSPGVISAFYPIRDEPDTLQLLAALSAAGFATALPITVGRGSRLIFRAWRPGEPTRPGQMAIPEPLDIAPVVEPDVLFTPLACFDRAGRRIGYGGGHYDRTLAQLRAQKSIWAVGVAFGVCEVAAVPYDGHDQALDAIVTERETLFFRAD